MLFNLALALLLALVPAPATAALDKPYMGEPPFDMKVWEARVGQALPQKSGGRNTWGPDWLPGGCVWPAFNERDSGGEMAAKINFKDIEAFNVWYDDCSTPWVFCRHKEAISQDAIIKLIGRMPVGFRDELRHALFLPSNGDGHSGMSWGDNILIRGNTPNLAVLVHELGHNLDRGRGLNGAWYSSSAGWITEYNKDPFVVSKYAQTSQGENFGEITRVALYDAVVPGGFGTLYSDWWKIFHQYATCRWIAGRAFVKGGTCQRRWGNDTPYYTGNKRSRMGTPPFVHGRAGPNHPHDNGTVVPPSAVRTHYDKYGQVVSSEVVYYK